MYNTGSLLYCTVNAHAANCMKKAPFGERPLVMAVSCGDNPILDDDEREETQRDAHDHHVHDKVADAQRKPCTNP